MSGVVSCILPEDFLTMALSNPALQFQKYYQPVHLNWHHLLCYGTSG